jgi:hypothetical protein
MVLGEITVALIYFTFPPMNVPPLMVFGSWGGQLDLCSFWGNGNGGGFENDETAEAGVD